MCHGNDRLINLAVGVVAVIVFQHETLKKPEA